MSTRIDLPLTRPCACGCGEPVATRGANGKPSYNRYVVGHQNHGRVQTDAVKQAVSVARRQQFNTAYPDGKRLCPRCEKALDLEAFFYSSKWREMCQPCNTKDTRFRYAQRVYGVTEEEYDALMLVTTCAICGCSAMESDRGILFIDHDHDTGKVREMLCAGCNRGLGQFNDDPERLRAAAAYIEKHGVQA